jgi:hypothetical protein
MTNQHQQLITLFSEHIKQITENIDYYSDLAWRFRWGSRALLIIALVALTFGSLAPFIQIIWKDRNIFAWGYAALVIAGLLIGADRAFLASQGWSRFVVAEIQLKALRNKLALEQRKFELTAHDDEAAKNQIEHITDLLSKYEEARASIVEAETKAWASELAAATADLEKRIATATAEATKTYADRSAAAAGSGAVRIKFASIPKDTSRIIVSVGGVSRDMTAPPETLVFENQSPGPRAVRVRWEKDNSWREIEEAADVKPGEIVDLTITFPSNSGGGI